MVLLRPITHHHHHIARAATSFTSPLHGSIPRPEECALIRSMKRFVEKSPRSEVNELPVTPLQPSVHPPSRDKFHDHLLVYGRVIPGDTDWCPSDSSIKKLIVFIWSVRIFMVCHRPNCFDSLHAGLLSPSLGNTLTHTFMRNSRERAVVDERMISMPTVPLQVVERKSPPPHYHNAGE